VNYEKDQQWFAWHQLALRRFLINAPQTPSIGDLWIPAGGLQQVDPTPSPESAQNIYWPQEDPSLVAKSTPMFEGLNTLYGACSQVVALEGDSWELSNVSTVAPVEVLCKQKLTIENVELQGQDDDDMFDSLYGDKVSIRCVLLVPQAKTIKSNLLSDLIKGIQAMFEPPDPVVACKREAKELSRQHVLLNQPAQPAYTPKAVVALQKRDKAKKAAVTKVMRTTKAPLVKATSGHKMKEMVSRAQAPQVPAARKRKSIATASPQRVPAAEHSETPAAKLCGCRHGDLAALKSFTRAEAAYYIRPNRFMEAIGCLDCAISVVHMLVGAPSQKAVVFYCDEGIKGFDAPTDDPMKEELTCDLVLCPPCMAIRRISYEKENDGRGRRGRNSRSSK
jgi:hypothetical protein